jgi:hypothetical protein
VETRRTFLHSFSFFKFFLPQTPVTIVLQVDNPKVKKREFSVAVFDPKASGPIHTHIHTTHTPVSEPKISGPTKRERERERERERKRERETCVCVCVFVFLFAFVCVCVCARARASWTCSV